MTPEGRIKAKLKRQIAAMNDEFGNHIYKFMPVQQGYGEQTLDFLLCVCGCFVAIETKAPGKKPTPRQKMAMDAISAAGGLAFVVHDDDSLNICMAIIAAIVNCHLTG